MAAAALAAALVLTLALSLTALALYERNETRLLKLSGRELALVVEGAIPSLQTPLASAAELANATDGNARKFRAFMTPYVGPGREFASASLWALGSATPKTIVGTAPALASHPAQARSFFAQARRAQALEVMGVLQSPRPSLGYAFSSPGAQGGFAAYAETPLPANRRSTVASGSAFSDLNYAFYLGRTRRRSSLLATNLHHFPIEGRQSSDVIPFGDSAFTLVVTPHGSLGGGFFESLPWIIGIFGTLVALAAAALTERLVRRRHYAEALAGDLDRVAAENRRLYTEQRGIAQTLQHALLPDALPELEGLCAEARYVPAGHGVDVGGDWYDVHALDHQRVLLVIGDVSGHGLGAATTMASLRHAALAYAVEGCRPGEVLEKLSNFVGDGVKRHFATVMCALIERDRHLVSVASAGHLPPLIIEGSDASFLGLEVGPPIGVVQGARYVESSAQVAPRAIFLAYTDGLVERRGEVLDVGLERLREAAVRERLPLEELLDRLTDELSSRQDDTAAVGIEWQS
jgi:serine phosphatase RsbU (regulator of sigma subunit)